MGVCLSYGADLDIEPNHLPHFWADAHGPNVHQLKAIHLVHTFANWFVLLGITIRQFAHVRAKTG